MQGPEGQELMGPLTRGGSFSHKGGTEELGRSAPPQSQGPSCLNIRSGREPGPCARTIALEMQKPLSFKALLGKWTLLFGQQIPTGPPVKREGDRAETATKEKGGPSLSLPMALFHSFCG